MSVYLKVFTGRGLQLLLLTLAAAAGIYSRAVFSPLQESMRIALSLSDNQVSLLQGPALAIPLVLATIPLGLAIDRYLRVRLLLILILLDLLGSVVTALASDFVLLFAARCLVGTTTLALNPVALSLLTDICPPAQRGRATMMIAVGTAVLIWAAPMLSRASLLGAATFAFGGRYLPGMEWRYAGELEEVTTGSVNI